jgi:hypothetical protein
MSIKALQQTAAAIPISRSSLSRSAAAAAELQRSAAESQEDADGRSDQTQNT